MRTRTTHRVRDTQAWTGLTRLREVVAGMASELREYRDSGGGALYDLPEAEVVAEDGLAPVRFLPAYDSAVLGHADRGRIVHSDDRQRVNPGYSVVRPTVLVDGFVAGTWSWSESGLVVSSFRRVRGDDRAALFAEAACVVAFIDPTQSTDTVRFT